jgi:hypothetical protein
LNRTLFANLEDQTSSDDPSEKRLGKVGLEKHGIRVQRRNRAW